MTKYLLLALLLFTSAAHAQSTVLIQKPTAKVYASPSLTSEVLVDLKKGNKVEVAGLTEKGDWAKIKVTVSGFQFDGWIQRSAITKPKAAPARPATAVKKPTTPQRVVPKQAAPTPALTQSSSSQLEQFFEPSSSSSTTSSSTPAPVEQNVARAEKPKKQARVRESQTGDNWKTGKLVLYGAPGYSIHQYVYSDSTRDAFRYNLTGITAVLGAEYKAFNFFDDLIRMSGQFQGQYAMYNTKTNLLDGTNVQFADLTARNAMMDLWFKLKFMVNFEKIVSKPFLLGFSGGYEYLKFFGDDIVADDGTPAGLYVDQTTTSIPVGVFAELHFLDPVIMILGSDVLLKSSASESPESSGSNPKPKMGLAPYFNLNFPISGDHHFMGIRYQLRIQETDFTGPSTTPRVNNTLNDANSSHVFHTLGLEYAYHF